MISAFYNGKVYTGTGQIAEAFAVENGVILTVGSNADILQMNVREKIDLQGNFVCPGFIDSHMHLLIYGQTLSIAPLHRHTDSMTEMIRCLSEAKPGRNGWIMGRGWNQDYFIDESRMPTRWDLDRVSVDFPVCAVRACGHALTVNSYALEFLGITSDTTQPDGGQIVTENGIPNGIFLDNAMDLVLKRIPAPDKQTVKDMIQSACRALNSKGITGAHSDDYCVFQNLHWETVNAAFRELEAAGELSVRVYEQANFSSVEELSNFVSSGNVTGTGSEYFRIGPVKLLGDGALGARTAYLSKCYEDDPSTRGLSIFSQEQFDDLICYAHCHGMQVAVHCIGDACLDMVLNSFEKAFTVLPREDCRHGIVHCQITRPDQLDRIVQLGLRIYAQSIFLDYDIHMVYPRVGKTLANSSYSWKTLLKRGISVSNGSDCPVEQPDVMAGIQCAVTRCDLQGVGPYLPEEAFTLEEALDSFTHAGAVASFEESVKGHIQPGMLADFVILEQDPFTVKKDNLKDIPVLATYLSGRNVYRA